MSLRTKKTMKIVDSSCPQSRLTFDKCDASKPPQRPFRYIPDSRTARIFRELGLTDDTNLYECSYCDVVYINMGVGGGETIIGESKPLGFVLHNEAREQVQMLLNRIEKRKHIVAMTKNSEARLSS